MQIGERSIVLCITVFVCVCKAQAEVPRILSELLNAKVNSDAAGALTTFEEEEGLKNNRGGFQERQDTNIFGVQNDAYTWNSYQRGVASCPCLTNAALPEISDEARSYMGEAIGDYDNYGKGCTQHDLTVPSCEDGCGSASNIAPASIGCDQSWCQRNWCWVDPDNCDLLNRHSILFGKSDLFFSYATCWDLDQFTSSNRIGSLEGRVLKAGFNSNSGGWLGAYSAAFQPNEGSSASPVAAGAHFVGPVSRWYGLAVNFVVQAASRAKFMIELTEPPAFLKAHAQLYFNSTSNFDYCVYAAALGYVDFCVAQYTITDERASTIDWFGLSSGDIVMIVQVEEELTGWPKFVQQTQTIFQPFTTNTWLFILLVIPILGGLMVVHEFGHAGSAFPKMESVVEVYKYDQFGAQEVMERKVPVYEHFFRSVYVAYLAVLQQNYSQSVVTYGAMMNLLGISFFILTIIAVYTANLAAILSQKPAVVTVTSLEEVVSQDLRICAERRTLGLVVSLHPNVIDINAFASDPTELGGDGQPGFANPNLLNRRRVFEMIDPVKAATDTRYCHLGLAPFEDLEAEQELGEFCSLGRSGDAIFGQKHTGIPVFSGVSEELISLFTTLKNDGLLGKEVEAARPKSQCAVEFSGEGSPLSISQLTGIWVVSFGFALVGLLVTFLSPLFRNCRSKTVYSVIGYDQSGNRINKMETADSRIDNRTTISHSGDSHRSRIFVPGTAGLGNPAATTNSDYHTGLNDGLDDSSSSRQSSRFGHANSEQAPHRRVAACASDDASADSGFHSRNGQNYRYT